MKNKIFVISFIFLLISITIISCTDIIEQVSQNELNKLSSTRALHFTDYYWHNDTKVGINKKTDKKYILFKSSDEQTVRNNCLQNLKSPVKIQELKLSSKIQKKENVNSGETLKWAIVETTDKLLTDSQIIYEGLSFTTENGTEVTLSHLLYVKLKSEKDESKLLELATENHVTVVGNNEYMPLWYTLACSKESSGDALVIANKFYETGLFTEAQPDLMSDDILYCVNDPHFSNYQWNLRNTGQNGGTAGVDVNFCNSIGISTGSSSVIVAVVDEGIQLNHPDLNIHPTSYDSESGTSPSVVYGTHGTNCAGFISARNNNGIGIAALAPNCPSMSISNTLLSNPDSRQKRADGINFAWRNGASVISNSWGSSVQYSIINDAISTALTNGRSGKGCVVVFASGNDYSASVGYPANCHPDILAVGSVNRNGSRSTFSNYGTNLDIVAPGENVCSTTTGSGYIMSTSGTSFSCPTAAAVAALVISVNSALTQKQVTNIIEKSARKIGNYSYTSTSGKPNGTWNNEMGYGLLDAHAAVSMANSGETVHFNDKTISSTQLVSGWNIFSQNITVINGATLTLAGSQSITINPPFTVNNGSSLVITH